MEFERETIPGSSSRNWMNVQACAEPCTEPCAELLAELSLKWPGSASPHLDLGLTPSAPQRSSAPHPTEPMDFLIHFSKARSNIKESSPLSSPPPASLPFLSLSIPSTPTANTPHSLSSSTSPPPAPFTPETAEPHLSLALSLTTLPAADTSARTQQPASKPTPTPSRTHTKRAPTIRTSSKRTPAKRTPSDKTPPSAKVTSSHGLVSPDVSATSLLPPAAQCLSSTPVAAATSLPAARKSSGNVALQAAAAPIGLQAPFAAPAVYPAPAPKSLLQALSAHSSATPTTRMGASPSAGVAAAASSSSPPSSATAAAAAAAAAASSVALSPSSSSAAAASARAALAAAAAVQESTRVLPISTPRPSLPPCKLPLAFTTPMRSPSKGSSFPSHRSCLRSRSGSALGGVSRNSSLKAAQLTLEPTQQSCAGGVAGSKHSPVATHSKEATRPSAAPAFDGRGDVSSPSLSLSLHQSSSHSGREEGARANGSPASAAESWVLTPIAVPAVTGISLSKKRRRQPVDAAAPPSGAPAAVTAGATAAATSAVISPAAPASPPAPTAATYTVPAAAVAAACDVPNLPSLDIAARKKRQHRTHPALLGLISPGSTSSSQSPASTTSLVSSLSATTVSSNRHMHMQGAQLSLPLGSSLAMQVPTRPLSSQASSTARSNLPGCNVVNLPASVLAPTISPTALARARRLQEHAAALSQSGMQGLLRTEPESELARIQKVIRHAEAAIRGSF
ncbi:unnamed protein product [Closterium sp. NIES-54]